MSGADANDAAAFAPPMQCVARTTGRSRGAGLSNLLASKTARTQWPQVRVGFATVTITHAREESVDYDSSGVAARR